MENVNKPLVLWICDIEGWAYEQRVKSVSKLMVDFDHEIFYVVSNGILALKNRIKQKDFDIVVCMYIQYVEILEKLNNVVCFAGGMRPFENEYNTEL